MDTASGITQHHPTIRLIGDGGVFTQAFDQFGFFSTDYEPPGSFAATRLVAPEAELLSMSDGVGLTNGSWSLYNYGLSHLFGGFGPYLTNPGWRLHRGLQ